MRRRVGAGSGHFCRNLQQGMRTSVAGSPVTVKHNRRDRLCNSRLFLPSSRTPTWIRNSDHKPKVASCIQKTDVNSNLFHHRPKVCSICFPSISSSALSIFCRSSADSKCPQAPHFPSPSFFRVKETSLLHSGQSNFIVGLGFTSQSSAYQVTARNMIGRTPCSLELWPHSVN
jgi:hypothetical protein